MNKKTSVLINDLAAEIIKIYNIKIPIDNIEDVVKKLGGTIKNDKNILVDGKIEKKGNKFQILIYEYQSEERKKFTIAHELGHLFIHMGYMINKELWDESNGFYNRSGNSEIEFQANEFAAAFLMPKDKYLEIMDKNTDKNSVNTKEIAKFFGVSVTAAANRGKFLGYLEWD